MSPDRHGGNTTALGVVAATTAAAVVAQGTAAWLLVRYRPSAPGVDPDALTGPARATAAWSAVHRGSLLALLGLLVVVVVLAPAASDDRRTRWAVLAAALTGVAGAALGALTTGRLAWDQVALEEVTVGTDVGGWRLAAFDDQVLFVLVDGAEVSPGTYAVALVVHLVAPTVALVALVVVGALLVRARRRSGATRDAADAVSPTDPATWAPR